MKKDILIGVEPTHSAGDAGHKYANSSGYANTEYQNLEYPVGIEPTCVTFKA